MPRRHGAIGLLAGAGLGDRISGEFLAAAAAPSGLAPVVALRETSVIFGTALGAIVLKEGFGARRLIAAGLVVGGIFVLGFFLG